MTEGPLRPHIGPLDFIQSPRGTFRPHCLLTLKTCVVTDIKGWLGDQGGGRVVMKGVGWVDTR